MPSPPRSRSCRPPPLAELLLKIGLCSLLHYRMVHRSRGGFQLPPMSLDRKCVEALLDRHHGNAVRLCIESAVHAQLYSDASSTLHAIAPRILCLHEVLFLRACYSAGSHMDHHPFGTSRLEGWLPKARSGSCARRSRRRIRPARRGLDAACVRTLVSS